MAEHKRNDAHIKRLASEIKGIKTVMFTSIGEDNHLKSRPMTAPNKEFDGFLWFFSHESDHKIKEIKKDSRVCISFESPQKQTWASISGNAEILTDKDLMKSLWHDDLKKWFPGGINEPGIVLIKVTAHKGEFWEPEEGVIGNLVEFFIVVAQGHESEAKSHDEYNDLG